MAEEILSNDLPPLKIVSASPVAAEREINRLLKDYVVFQYFVHAVGDGIQVTALMMSQAAMRRMQLANIQPAGRRQ
jgi:hypothetical protein